jgi:hypothetical protein
MPVTSSITRSALEIFWPASVTSPRMPGFTRVGPVCVPNRPAILNVNHRLFCHGLRRLVVAPAVKNRMTGLAGRRPFQKRNFGDQARIEPEVTAVYFGGRRVKEWTGFASQRVGLALQHRQL